MTNGSGMVQFSRGFMRFGKTLPIVPVALRVTVPWNIQTHTLTSSFAANLFWVCFVPWVRLDATVLQPMSLTSVRLVLPCALSTTALSRLDLSARLVTIWHVWPPLVYAYHTRMRQLS